MPGGSAGKTAVAWVGARASVRVTESDLGNGKVVNLLYSKGGQSAANVGAEDLVAASLRMGMDYILNQELRDKAAFAFMNVLESGHPGMTTVHVNRTLRRAVNRASRCRPDRRDGADVDDGATAGVEGCDRFLRGEEQAEHVKIELLMEMFRGDLFKRQELIDTSVVHQNVEFAERFPGGGEQPFYFIRLRNVRLNRDRFAA